MMKQRRKIKNEIEKNAIKDLKDAITEDTKPWVVNQRLERLQILLNVPVVDWVSSYYNVLRIRGGFFFVVVSVVLFSNFSGILTEALVGTFATVSTTDGSVSLFGRRPFTLLCMPVLMMGFAFTVEKMYFLSLDVLDRPPLARFQATLLAAANPYPAKSPSWRLCLSVDFAVFGFFELWPFVTGLLGIRWHKDDPDGRGWNGAFLQSYVWGGLTSCFVAALLFSIAELVCHGRTFGKLAHEVGDGCEAIAVYQRAIQDQRVFPINPFLNFCYDWPWKRSGLSRLHDCCFSAHLTPEDKKGIEDIKMLNVGKVKDNCSALFFLAITALMWIAVWYFAVYCSRESRRAENLVEPLLMEPLLVAAQMRPLRCTIILYNAL